MIIRERITNLRKLMEEKNFDFYIIPTADFHQSEYVGDYFKSREYITGFTGSQGTAIVGKDSAYLWVDGRYFLQAENQLKDTGVQLMKMGEEGVPAIDTFLKEKLSENNILAFDGRVVSFKEGKLYKQIADLNNASVVYDVDLIDEIWQDRPEISKEKAFTLDIKYAGESTESKLQRIRDVMESKGASSHILTTIDDICWILNIRGNDVKYFPLVLSYALITLDKMYLYIDETKLDDEMLESFKKNNIYIREYNQIYEDAKNIDESETVLIDMEKINCTLKQYTK